MQLESIWSLKKQFFRFTGPPEHWLTAVKYMTWGLEEKYKERWQNIQSGDIFFIHSTGASMFSNAHSGIIGLGVIGPNFSIKENPLWLAEQVNHVNQWPLLVPLSEIYLFSELPSPDTWENPQTNNQKSTEILIDKLLANSIPLSSIKGFPQMGSFSAVSEGVAQQILLDKKPLYLYTDDPGDASSSIIQTKQAPKLSVLKSSSDAIRYADTLKVFDSVAKRVVKEPDSHYSRDNTLLERAETVHQTILEQLIQLFRSKGYETLYSKKVDLFAHNGTKAFIFDAKSTENNNFRSQARKGLAQLLEYDYFEINKFSSDNSILFKEKYKLIALSQKPQDTGYVDFLNSISIGVATTESNSLTAVGQDFGFTNV